MSWLDRAQLSLVRRGDGICLWAKRRFVARLRESPLVAHKEVKNWKRIQVLPSTFHTSWKMVAIAFCVLELLTLHSFAFFVMAL